jgi:monoamine oxidase
MDTKKQRAVKTKLLQSIQRAYQIALGSKQKGIPLHEYHQSLQITRRQFLATTGKASLFTLAAGASFITACTSANKPTIAIVGAGIAGLNAAYTLKRAGFIAQVYEASDRTGGRIITATDLMGKGLTTEMGGEFIDSTHADMLLLAQTFNLPLLDTFVPSESNLIHACYYINNKVITDKDILELFYPYTEKLSADIDSISDEISYSNHTENDARLDNMSIAQYLQSIGITGDLYKLLDVAYTTEYGCDIEQQSAINFLMLMNPDMHDTFNYSGFSDERYKIKGGNQLITDALEKRLESQLNKGHKLEAIQRSDINGKTTLTFAIEGGVKEVVADFVILALPFTVLREIKMDCGFNKPKLKAINEMGYGKNAKFFHGFSKAHWRDLGYTGFTFTDTNLQNGWDNSQLQQGEGAGFTIFTGGKAGEVLNQLSDAEIATQLYPIMENCFPGITGLQTGKMARFYWAGSPFAKASYACFAPGQYTTIEGAQREPSGNIYFAGEHCSFEFQGFMNGAAQTGREAAEAILKAMG